MLRSENTSEIRNFYIKYIGEKRNLLISKQSSGVTICNLWKLKEITMPGNNEITKRNVLYMF